MEGRSSTSHINLSESNIVVHSEATSSLYCGSATIAEAEGDPPKIHTSDIANRASRAGFSWEQASYPLRTGG